VSTFCVCVSAYRSICVSLVSPYQEVKCQSRVIESQLLRACPHLRVGSIAFSDFTTRPQLYLLPIFLTTMPSSAKKRTVAKQPQPPATISAPAVPLPYPAPTSSPSTYTPITDTVSIERLVGLARDSPHDSALGIVWQRALEEGKKIGYSEGAKLFEGVDISEGMRAAAERGYERGIEEGRTWEKCAWGAASHSNICITVARPPRGVAIQMDDPPPRLTSTAATQANTPPPLVATAAVQVNTPQPPPPLYVTVQTDVLRTIPFGTRDASSQTTSQPSPIPDPVHSLPPTPLNWADDVTSLPISSLPISTLPIPTPPILSNRLAPRDLSVLRSTKRNPFGSLQRRSKQFRAWVSSRFHQNIPSRSLHSCYRPPPLHPPSLFPKPRVLPQASKNEPFVFLPSSLTSALDWDQDPRLSDLSRALKALGWIRP